MAVVIQINKEGKHSYQAASQGIISDEEISRADKLNDLIAKEIKKYIKSAEKQNGKKGKVGFYWGFGNILRKIFFSSELIDENEKELFFTNVRLHMDSYNETFPKNDLTRNRNIPKQFFKLAGYPLEVASKIEWAQWSYLFDNTHLMQSTGFDEWFLEILKSDKYKFNESFTRLWAESFNLLLKNTDIESWTEKEKLKPITNTLDVVSGLVKEGISIDDRVVRKELRNVLSSILKKHKREFILMQMGEISSQQYVNVILKEVVNILKALKKLQN